MSNHGWSKSRHCSKIPLNLTKGLLPGFLVPRFILPGTFTFWNRKYPPWHQLVFLTYEEFLLWPLVWNPLKDYINTVNMIGNVMKMKTNSIYRLCNIISPISVLGLAMIPPKQLQILNFKRIFAASC